MIAIVLVAWLALGFLSGFIIGSILRERDREHDDGPRVELE